MKPIFGLLLVGCGAWAAAAAAQTPATIADQQAMSKMMTAMNQSMTGNPDIDFVQGMLPHHQGAIDMAQVELTYGHDPAMRQLARQIIASQTREQGLMRQWLSRHAAR